MFPRLEKHERKLILGQVQSNEVIQPDDRVAFAKGKSITGKDPEQFGSR